MSILIFGKNGWIGGKLIALLQGELVYDHAYMGFIAGTSAARDHKMLASRSVIKGEISVI